MAVSQEFKTYCARFVRKLILRGRAATGFYSMEGYQSAPDEPQQNIVAKRAQHYGFLSEAPDGAEVIALAINGGASNRVGIAETVTDEPTIAQDEVLLWARPGQRLLLDKDKRVSIGNGNGGTVIIDGNTTTITDDVVVTRDTTVTRDATVARDTKVAHIIGGGDVSHGCIPAAPAVPTATATGDDLSFDVTFSVAPSLILNPGNLVATVGLSRSFASEPRCVASPTSGSFPGPASFGAKATTGGVLEVRYYGQAINGPVANLVCTVFVVGKR